MTTPGLGDFAVLPISGQVGELVSIGEWLCGDGFHRYDHAEVFAVVPGDEFVLGETMGAYPDGADLVPVPEIQDEWLWSTGAIQLTDMQRDKIVQTALSLKGTPYSALDYFAIAGRRLHIPDPDRELENYIKSTKHMICSQLVDYCYMMAGVHLFNDGRWEGYVTPADLANVIAHPGNITYGKATRVKPPMRTP